MLSADDVACLPELTGGMVLEQAIIDGKTIFIPRMTFIPALFQDYKDLLLCEDPEGKAWATGWYQGVRYKVRRPQFDAYREPGESRSEAR